ncbi:hypothetical protein CALVIDRAFT_512513 [Calocera viscosa TUFC12733]|uniref:COP9 signalosome complex subunit 4 n=1 Tax=Calocera viscosa (strain TUFC12733) TaxID=1330018 RepID=A0A167NR54_CALVF|nr:hypothetical protein CALVIDRAFT_512513 [Calocera viscosa TUFC12733]
MDLPTRLAQLSSISAQRDKSTACTTLLNDLLSSPSTAPGVVVDFVDAIVNQDVVGQVIARQALGELVKKLAEGCPATADREKKKDLIRGALEKIQARLVTFDEYASQLREQLATLFEQEEEWSDAARVLMGMTFDSGTRVIADEDKLRIYIRIVRLLLEDEDSVQAETYYNRAALLSNATQDRELQLQFKLCQARIFDYSRRFAEAASRYHELSWIGELDEEDRMQCLSAAVTCAVLAPAGPQRSRILATLYRDDRTQDLPSHTILSKMFLDHILRPSEVAGFEATLKSHQLAKIAQSSSDKASTAAAASRDEDVEIQDADAEPVITRTGPTTVLDRAVLEHNLLSASMIYNNITFAGLGSLLSLTPGAAETMARRMIEQGRLRGWIDQVERVVYFEGGKEDEDGQGKVGGLGEVAEKKEEENIGGGRTRVWDRQIRQTAASVELIVQRLTDKGLLNNLPPLRIQA